MVDTEFPVEDKFDHLAAPRREATRARGVTAFVTVQEGCDKFCTFCVVPYTRGAEISRPARRSSPKSSGSPRRRARGHADRAERQRLSRRRTRRTAGTLARLLQRLAEVPGIARLRYTTCHPRDMGDDLIAAHRDLPALMPQLHLPVQSGSDRILAAMNRTPYRARIISTVGRLRAAGRIWLSRRILSSAFRRNRAGFPRHARADRRGRLRRRFSFKYSPRPGTPAADGTTRCRKAKTRTPARLQACDRPHQARFQRAAASAGRFDVLFEKPGRHPGQIAAARLSAARAGDGAADR